MRSRQVKIAAMAERTNLLFIGPTGAGKTTVGKRVASQLGLEFLDVDQEIERQTGADISLIFDIEGEAGFRKRETAMIDQLTRRNGIVLATGAGAVLADENRRLLSSRGFVIYLATPVQRQIQRLQRDKRRPLLQAANREEVLSEMAATRNPLYESLADLVVYSEAVSVRAMAQRVLNKLQPVVPAHD